MLSGFYKNLVSPKIRVKPRIAVALVDKIWFGSQPLLSVTLANFNVPSFTDAKLNAHRKEEIIA